MSQQKIDRITSGKPIVVVYFKEGTLREYPFNKHEYLQSYIDFFKLAEPHFSFFIVRGMRDYKGNGIFKSGYRFDGKKFIHYRRPIAAKVVYDKDSGGSLSARPGKGWAIVNHPALSRLLLNKDFTYTKFKKYMKPLFRVKTKKDCIHVLKKIKTSLAVFKPRSGYGGNGIIIAEKTNFLDRLTCHNGLIGEFIDGANGIPGITDSYHDLRLTIADGETIEVLVRIPKKGSLLANISQGASAKLLPPSQAPVDARNIVSRIDRMVSKFGHRLYSVDFLYENGKPYVVELNARPGLPFKAWGSVYGRWHQGLLKVLRAAAHDTQ